MIARAWCDPVKSNNDAAVQLTTMKMGENKATMLKKTEPAKGSTEWLKKSQARPREITFLSILAEKKRLQWLEPLDKVIYSREFSENVWRHQFSNPCIRRKPNLQAPILGNLLGGLSRRKSLIGASSHLYKIKTSAIKRRNIQRNIYGSLFLI